MRFGGFSRFALGALAAISQHFTIPFLPPMIEGPRPPQPRGFKKNGRYRGRVRGHRPNNTGWWQRRAVINPPLQITEQMLQRHGWYRRQQRKAAANANL